MEIELGCLYLGNQTIKIYSFLPPVIFVWLKIPICGYSIAIRIKLNLTKPKKLKKMSDNFICTFNLKDQNDKQFVYSSQLYGTHFCVYAKVVLDSTETKINGLKFYLINYKGILNLGLIKDKMENQQVVFSDGEINFRLHLRALESTHGETLFCTLPLNEIPVNELNFMEIDRKLHPLSSTNGENHPFTGQVFDSEFFDRDGVFVQPRINPEDNSVEARAPGLRCRTARLKLVNI